MIPAWYMKFIPGQRWFWFASVFVALLVFGAYFGCLLASESEVRWRNLQRIKLGMTLSEVESLIGSQPHARSHNVGPFTENSPPDYQTLLFWSFKEYDILVYLDEGGRVIGREGVRSHSTSWYDRLCRRLSLI